MIIIQYESFRNLEEAKKQNIINAGFMVFGEHGYKKASVDAIVKAAGISKGSLFYYFESKKNFFLYLYQYCGEQMETLIDFPDSNGAPSYMKNTDFFERLNAIQFIKMKHAGDFPYMYSFMKKAVFETDPAVRTYIMKINQQYIKERTLDFLQNLDYYKFKEGIDPKMVMQLIAWCSEGSANLLLAKEKMNPSSTSSVPDFNEVYSIFKSYVDLLRNNFYKEQYL